MRHWMPLAAAVAAMSLFSCSDDSVSEWGEVGSAHKAPLRTLPWLADFKIGAAPASGGSGALRVRTNFRTGQSIWLTMRVNDVPRNTRVTAYWYGPGGQPLAYETKAIEPNQELLQFTQDYTLDWQPGVYRAEIWVRSARLNRQILLKEQRFDIVAAQTS